MKKILYFLLGLLGLILVFVPLNTDCASCNQFMKDGSYTGNHMTAFILTGMGIIIVLFVILSLLIKKDAIGYITYIISFCLSVFGLLVIRSIIKIKWRFLLDLCGANSAVCQNCHMGVVDGSHERFVLINTIILTVLFFVSLVGFISLFLGKKKNAQ